MIISILNYKGGVAKTTTTLNLGTALWLLDKSVLLIDTDSQCNLTKALGFDPKTDGNETIYEMLTGKCQSFPIYERGKGLDYMPGSPALESIAKELPEYKKLTVLRYYLSQIATQYDYILIDCPPSASLLNYNAMIASESIIIPLECAAFSVQGSLKLSPDIEGIKAELNPKLSILGYLFTKYDKRTNIARQVKELFEQDKKIPTFKTVIRRCVAFDSTPIEHQSIFEFDAESNGAKDYLALAEEITKTKRKKNWKRKINPS